jgi:hypothetical protein
MRFDEFEATLAASPARITACVYGAPKTGKTRAVAELAEHGFTLHWFDLENGFETLRQLSTEAKKNIILHRIPDTRGMPMAIETILKVIKGVKMTVCQRHGKADPVGCPLCRKEGGVISQVELAALGPKDIVVIDSASQLTDSCISHVCRGQNDEYKMQRDDWGGVGKLLGTVLSYVQAAQFHCIVIAHELDPESDPAKSGKLVPAIGTKNFALSAGKYFGHVVYVSTKNRKHVASSATTSSTSFTSGSRTNVDLDKAGESYSLFEIFKSFQ